MRDLEIDRAEVLVAGPPTERHAWALDMEAQFMSHTVLRLTTRGGLQGIAGAAAFSGHSYDLSVGETLRTMLPDVLGRSIAQPEALWRQTYSLTLPRAPQSFALIDVACWDALGRCAGLPLWQLLGGARDSIRAYASTPLMADVDAYIELVERLHGEGFSAVKLHCWCEPGRDGELVEALAERFDDHDLAFMLDVEQRYDRRQALTMGSLLGELGFRWFEAPLDDFDTEGYADLTARLELPVIPAGNSIIDLRQIARCLADECWGAVRVDAMSCGGITPARKIMALAAAHGLDVELQCWGYTPHQAANLHLMLAQPNSSFFEQPVPYAAFEHGTTTPIRVGTDGHVRPPTGPGLGVELDWPALEAAALMRFEVKA